ncbi:MAG: hypothetical protein KIS76_06595 [Pyrinomonadaceae bacterium]|nr:hypothetical protein [Pyrinomonadaceae bacterium]
MKAYKTYSTVSDTKQVILSNVPFRVGEKVEIVVLTTENGERAARVRKLRNLFKETQSLPQIQTLSEDDILREVEAYRNGK